MALSGPAGPIDPENTENYEEIEKQFAVKGIASFQHVRSKIADEI